MGRISDSKNDSSVRHIVVLLLDGTVCLVKKHGLIDMVGLTKEVMVGPI